MKIGIAFGSGSARGWAHLGVLRSLSELGIQPDVVVGASAGALVAAAFATNTIDPLEEWALSLTRSDVWRLLDTTFGGGGGMMKGDRLMRAVAKIIPDKRIESLTLPFASVAADLSTGAEIWIRDGSLHHAIRASSGFPGLFTPVPDGKRWLIDGGVVNPVPVSLCRALGADFVIAINLNQHSNPRAKHVARINRTAKATDARANVENNGEAGAKWTSLINRFITSRFADKDDNEPGLVEVMTATINIMQDRISRSRMVGDPPDVTISPNLTDFQMMDFHRAEEAIREGSESVARALPDLQPLLH